MLEYLVQRLGRIPCLGYYFHVRLILEQAPQSLPQQDMVVHQNASNFLARISSRICAGGHTGPP